MKPTRTRLDSRKRGIALVIVLSFIALIASLVIAYFSSASAELSNSKAFAVSTDTKMLADTVVDIVSAQIREATAPLPKGAPLSWTSQPGMIRVFGSPTAASSEPYAYYKLYSSDNMVVTTGFGGFTPDADIKDFVTSPDLYTDLNKPVLVPDTRGTIIVDTQRYRADYPILDPSALLSPDPKPVTGVEGLGLGPSTRTPELVKPPGYNGTYPVRADYNPVANPNPAPMPVRWLYVLRDGSIAVPTSALLGVTTFGGTVRPTLANPIVGRIAFWSDDDTSKININTASEATFWDTPLTSSWADAVAPYQGLGQYQPTAGEYQRYPGHPATTCLSPVFGLAMGWAPPTGNTPIAYGDPTYLALKETIYSIIPRVNTGGSTSASLPVTAVTAVPAEGDRLYSSVDELLYKPGMNPATGTALQTRQLNLRMSTQLIQQAKFFLTANNRAPELNLFGRPRISIWPVNSNEALRSAKDNVFAFCSTIGSKTLGMGSGHYPFYFARSNSRSPSVDYLDTARTGRNTKLYEYLQNLTSQMEPGFGGGTFLAKYPKPTGVAGSASDRDQILTEIFDYIRCINLSDGSNTGGTPFTPAYTSNGSDYAGQVTPIQIGNTRGFGRFPTPSEAILVFSKESRGSKKATDPDRMRAVLLVELFNPAFGWMGMKDTYAMKVDSTLKISDPTSGAEINLFNSGAINTITTGVHHGMHGRFLGGHLGIGNQFFYDVSPKKKTLDRAGSGVDSKYPFVSDWISFPVPVAGQPPKTFKIIGGSITVSMYAGRNPSTDPIVQTVTFDFPQNSVLRVPTTTGSGTSETSEFETRIPSVPNSTDVPGTDKWILSVDAVRSVEAKTDLRLIAGRQNVTNLPSFSYFGPTGDPLKARWTADFTNPATNNVIHSLRMNIGQRYLTAVPTGVFVAQGTAPNFTYPNYKWDAVNIAGAPRYFSSDNQARMADLPEEIRGGVMRLDGGPGDWDTGVSKMYDGAFINKPDEGESSDGSTIPYFLIADFQAAANTLYSPNRIIASPGWFGSLPTGLQRNHPYETLLFRPDYTNHPGLADPPDHLLLDLFNMPVVEPYPISEPFSTAGKVNLNYQIMPFSSYLKRDTAVRAVLRAEKLLCIPFKALNGGKTEGYDGNTTDYRHQIDEDTTLAFLERRWKDGKPSNQVFRSASQICELDLYPKPNNDTTAGNNNIGIPVATAAEGRSGLDVSGRWNAFWKQTYSLTGDNARERTYARLYPRLTTKSNTFTVHMRVQSLSGKPDPAAINTWNDNTGTITGEYRGSSVIERYLDPSDRRFNPNGSGDGNTEKFNPDTDSLEAAYRFRVLTTKQFAP